MLIVANECLHKAYAAYARRHGSLGLRPGESSSSRKIDTCPTCPATQKLPVGDLSHLGLNIHTIDVTSEAQIVQPHQLRATTLDSQLQQCTGSVPKAGEIPVLVLQING